MRVPGSTTATNVAVVLVRNKKVQLKPRLARDSAATWRLCLYTVAEIDLNCAAT